MKALTLTFALLLICTGAALAQTPDGETPAEETVCGNETGAAHGLCTTYCGAMDCDSPDAQASATACSEVQENFQQITGRSLTCEGGGGSTCPCVDFFAPYFAAQLAAPGGCVDSGTQIVKFQDGSPNAIFAAYGPEVDTVCSIFDIDNLGKNVRTRKISPEEASVCAQLIRDSCPPE
jgi:hypothetical protein